MRHRHPLATTLLLASLLLGAGPAAAQYELTWDRCPGSMGAVVNKTFACNDDYAPPMKLVLAFTPPKALPRFVGFWAELEVSSSSGSLPDWWRAGSGECREGAIVASVSTGGVLGTCQNPWQGALTGGAGMWESEMGSGRAILKFGFARATSAPPPASPATSLQGGTRYYGMTFTVDAVHTTGSDGQTCAGCAAEACISLNRILLAQEQRGPTPENDDEIEINRSSGVSVVTFNSRDPGSNPCGSTVRNATWGRIKKTYR